MLRSDWYKSRLAIKQSRDIALWTRHVRTLEEFMGRPGHRDEALRLGIEERLDLAKTELERVRSREYLQSLEGTIGADPIHAGAETAVQPEKGGGQREMRLN
jgi:hypothetical protein